MITSKCDEEKKTSKQKIAAMSKTDNLKKRNFSTYLFRENFFK